MLAVMVSVGIVVTLAFFMVFGVTADTLPNYIIWVSKLSCLVWLVHSLSSGIHVQLVLENDSLKKIAKPPGRWLDLFAEFFYSTKTYERVFQQIICDFRGEYFDALSANRKWKAKWIRSRYTVHFAKTVVAHGIAYFGDVFGIGKLFKFMRGD